MQKFLKIVFFILVCLSVTAAFWVFKDLLFPFVTSKAFFFRIAVEFALPLYLYFLIVDKSLRPSLKNPVNLAMLAFVVVNFAAALRIHLPVHEPSPAATNPDLAAALLRGYFGSGRTLISP